MPIWVGSWRGIRFEGSRKGHTLIGSYGKMIWKRKWNSLNIKISTKSSFCIQFLILNCCCSSLIIRSSNRAGIVVNCVFFCPQKMAKIRKQLMLILDQQVRVYQMLFFFLSKNAFYAWNMCICRNLPDHLFVFKHKKMAFRRLTQIFLCENYTKLEPYKNSESELKVIN